MFSVKPPDIDESWLLGESPHKYVTRLAEEKVRALDVEDGMVILGGDTVVVLDGEIIGKPADLNEARMILAKLVGRSHFVYSSYAVRDKDRLVFGYDQASVYLKTLNAEAIEEYLNNCPDVLTKAGGYAIQNKKWSFVERIEGEKTTVVGLPMSLVVKELAGFGVVARHTQPR